MIREPESKIGIPDVAPDIPQLAPALPLSASASRRPCQPVRAPGSPPRACASRETVLPMCLIGRRNDLAQSSSGGEPGSDHEALRFQHAATSIEPTALAMVPVYVRSRSDHLAADRAHPETCPELCTDEK